MMEKSCVPVIAFIASLTSAEAAAVQRDVEPGLVYIRTHELPRDLPADEGSPHGTSILDVRYARGDPAAAALLLGWLKSHSGPKSPVFLLANPETSAALLAPLNSTEVVPNLVILGPAAPHFEPDISLKVPSSLERRAYDAFEKGATIDSLIRAPVEKVRDDEEHLEKDHLSDTAPGPETKAEPAKAAPESSPPPLIDAVLQRAVQLHEALLALKRL